MSTPTTTVNKLWTPIQYGAVEAQNRVVLAPLTRFRADTDLAPTDLHVKYYSDRADGNLLITEATVISQQSISSKHIPGCFNELQAKAWRKVTDAVHAKGAKMSLQAWHQGRVAPKSFTDHPLAKEVNAQVGESSSEIAISGYYAAPHYLTDETTPPEGARIMTVDDIKRFQQQLLDAADLAFNIAGFDLFELHGAHGYLLDQFLNEGSNTRTDQYGGSFENRFRLIAECLELLCAKYPGRIAIRISPHNGAGFYDVTDSNSIELYNYAYERLGEYDLAYVLCTEPRWNFGYTGNPENDEFYNLPLFSAQFTAKLKKINPKTAIIGCGGFTAESALKVMELGLGYDAIGFGRWYISTPDLVFRLKHGLPWTRYNRNTFDQRPPFTQDFALGYNDYLSFKEQAQKALGDDIDIDQVIQDEALIAKIVEAHKDELYALIPVDVIGTSKSTQDREVGLSA